MQNTKERKETDCQHDEGTCIYEHILENVTCDASQKTAVSLNHRSHASFSVANWKESPGVDTTFFPEEESIGREEPAHQRILGWQEENINGEYTIKKEWQESVRKEVSQSEQLPVMPLLVPHEKPFVEMGESLLDCIIKDSPIKNVSDFLTQPHASLFKIYPSSGTKKQFSGQDNLNMDNTTPTREEVMAATREQIDPSNNNSVSSDSFCENIMYVRSPIQSNREVKRGRKKSETQYNNQGSSDREFPPEPEMPEADKEFSLQRSKMSLAPTEEYKQGDISNTGAFSTHRTRSPCPSLCKASLDICETKYSNYHLEKLSFCDRAVNFTEVIKELEQAQQEQTQIMDLQCDDMFLEKIKDGAKLMLKEGNLGLEDVTGKMKWNEKKEPTQIIDSYYDTISLDTNFKELKTVQQHHLEETINKLKKNTEDRSEAEGKVTKERNEARRQLLLMQEALFSAIRCLEDVGNENKGLQKHVEELKSACYLLHIKYEVELKNRYRRQCLKMDNTIRKKDKKIQELQHLRQKMEHEVKTLTSALHMLREENENREKSLLSMQTKFQVEKDGELAERQQQEYKRNKLEAQLRVLQAEFENKQPEMKKMQTSEFRRELQQQRVKDHEQNCILQLETGRWKNRGDKAREPHTAKDRDHPSSTEHNMKNETITKLQEKVKNLTCQKKTLDKKMEKLKNDLALKEDECRSLRGENDKLHEELRRWN